MKHIATIALAAAAVIALASHESGAVAPMQSPVAPTATRSRWRDLPVTPTPGTVAAQHGRIRDARYELRLPMIGR